jgi:hypothetical protein
MMTHTSFKVAARELSMNIDPGRVVTDGPSYDDCLRIWNGAIRCRPGLFVRCQTSGDVQSAIRIARLHHLPISVRGGGHDWAGRAFCDGGLVIDLSAMRNIVVDPARCVATVAGGATIEDLVAAATPHKLAAATGTVGSVGVAGLTLGGGYGPLSGRVGLAVDNLLAAEVVLADGRVTMTDTENEPELYWAIRGGGGNFGVVTSLTIKLHPVDRLLGGFVLYPWSEAGSVLRRFSKFVADAPDDLTVQSGVVSGPDGALVVLLSPTWSGHLQRGAEVVNGLRQLGTPLLWQVAPMTPVDMVRLWDPYVVFGRHYAIRTRSVAAFTPEVIAALVSAGTSRTSALSAISIHHFHGEAARIPVADTAFGIRRDHFMFEIVAGWEPQDGDPARHRAWADSVSVELGISALPGGYANLLGPTDDEQIAHAYGPNWHRLQPVKLRYDPDGIFSAIPLPHRVARANALPGTDLTYFTAEP